MTNKNMVKFAKNTILGTALLCGGLLLTGSTTAHAAAWHANTPDQIQIVKGQRVYTVKRGDTLWAISIKTNIKIQTLADASGITNPNFIQVGQKIILNGDHMTIKNAQGNTIATKQLTPSDKVVQNQKFGTPVHNTAAMQHNTYTAPTTVPVAQPSQGQQSNSTAVQPVNPSQGQQGDSTATQPTNPSQGQQGGSTTTQPTNPSQGQQGGSTTTKSSNPSQGQQGGSTTTKPTNPSQGQQGGSTTTKPTDPSQGQQGGSTTTKPTNPSQGQQSGSTTKPTHDDNNYLSDPNDKQSFFNEQGLKEVETDFVALMNKARVAKGMKALTIDPSLQQSSAVRGRENQHAHETTNDYDKHVRPDGSDALTAIHVGNYWGEVEGDAVAGGNQNLAYAAEASLTPKAAAEYLWKGLSGDAPHYAIMMDPKFTRVGVNVLPTICKDKTRWYTLVADFAN